MAVSSNSGNSRVHQSGMRKERRISRETIVETVTNHTNALRKFRIFVSVIFMAMILTLSMITARAPEYLPLYLVGSGAIVTLLISAIIMLRSRCPSCGQLFSQTAMREEALYTDIITETTMPRKSPAAHYPLSIYSSACKNCGRIRLFVK